MYLKDDITSPNHIWAVCVKILIQIVIGTFFLFLLI